MQPTGRINYQEINLPGNSCLDCIESDCCRIAALLMPNQVNTGPLTAASGM